MTIKSKLKSVVKNKSTRKNFDSSQSFFQVVLIDYKVIVMGDTYAGNSDIVSVFVRNTYISDKAYMPALVD